MPNSCQQSTNDDDSALTDDDIGYLLNLCSTVPQAAQNYDLTDILQCPSLQKVDEHLQYVKQKLSASSRTAKLLG